jgi:hypothetical protein
LFENILKEDKMNRRNFLVTLLAASLMSLILQPTEAAAARTRAIYNVLVAPAVTGSGEPISLEQLEVVLRSAAISKGWEVKKIGEKHLEAWIYVRQHMAKVDIYYTEETYSITYKDSEVLMYDGRKIHRNYNNWIMLMNEQIVVRLNDL